jgi:hypothetical protein
MKLIIRLGYPREIKPLLSHEEVRKIRRSVELFPNSSYTIFGILTNQQVSAIVALLRGFILYIDEYGWENDAI